MSSTQGLALAAALTLAACGDDDLTGLEEFAARIKAREPNPIDPIPESERPDAFLYEPDGRRDPFVPENPRADSLPVTAERGNAADPLRRKEELEQYALDSLTMVGTLQQGERIWALIAAPAGQLYRVSTGNYLGRNNGRITGVTEDGIELIELVSEGDNDWRERSAAISLSQ
jgi:type IV pilus assembly protein PilP